VPLTEGGGRYTFRPTSDLPPPRQIQSGKKHRVYPSGESKGNSKFMVDFIYIFFCILIWAVLNIGYPLDYSRLR
jgi:hypothetical protein